MAEIKSINPKNGDHLKTYSVTDKKLVNSIVNKAHVAQAKWASVSVAERISYFKRLRNHFVEKQETICRDIALDTGKSDYEALIGEFVVILGILNYYIKRSKQILKKKRLRHKVYKNKRSYISYDPVGVVAVISPWNYPLLLSITPMIAALLAGNAVVFKPSEFTLYIGEKLIQLFKDASFPEDLVSIIYGDGKTGDHLIHENIQKICFTGSVKTGKYIAKVAGERLIPVTLELGGKDPFIVLNDAPLERAAKAAIWASTFNAGQTCAGVERIIVQRAISQKFIEKLKEELNRLNLSNTNRELACMNNEKQYNLVMDQLADAEKNSKEVYKKEFPEGIDGLYNVPAAIIIEPNKEAKILHEETFGPLASVEIVETEEDAINKANDSEYGLTASLWTNSRSKASIYADKLKAGSVYINDHLAPQAAPEAPWGGVKASGIGRTRAEEGLLSMCNIKHISYDRLKLKKEFFWFPYSNKKELLMKKLIQLLKWL
jgi:acyl-CoA reductase-like NAD-dependent aldehyde dehydrogenase